MSEILDFLVQHWQLSAAFIILLSAYLIYEYMQSEDDEAITPDTAVAIINHQHGVVIDVRTKAEFETGHILHALHVDASEADTNAKKLHNKYAQKPIILVCARGRRSAQCVERFKNQGFTTVYTLAGGLQAWQDAGLPLVNK